MIYCDFAATTPIDPEVAQVYTKVATEYYGNSSSLHDIGGLSHSLLENCREELANLIGIDKSGLFFTSGGSEANFLAIEALLSSPKKEGNHIIAGIAEHSSVHGTLNRLKKAGYEITLVPFHSAGLIDQEQLLHAIKSETILVILQHVNSEIGTIQPIEEMAKVCNVNNIHLHCDIVQSFGKIDVKPIAPFVSSLSFSGHKIYGPKGIGGAYIDPRIKWEPFFPGASHEKGFRPGTLNIPAIAAMTVAAQKVHARLGEDTIHFQSLRRNFIEALGPIKDRIKLYQAGEEFQLPSIIGLGISGIQGQWLMLECNRLGFAISTGSACQIGMQQPAKVTQALGLNSEEAKEFIRVSFGQSTSLEDVVRLGETIVTIVKTF
ncbi:IscS subfamily cysteine desulfurase [Neobacillus drentensis]|uniref:IscS subfamily cysteine desulfurase n=1 Tax=Neobacillus drentensis TaxID=220684 RepID=UPI003000D43E